MKSLRGYFLSLVDPKFMPIALKVTVAIGSLLFVINHGASFVQGQMPRDRWVSAAITYAVPYFVNIHGQYVSSSRRL